MIKTSFIVTILDKDANGDAAFAKTILTDSIATGFGKLNTALTFQIENSYQNLPNPEHPDTTDGVGNWCIEDICNHYNITEELVNNPTFYEQATIALEQIKTKAEPDWEELGYWCNRFIDRKFTGKI